MSLTTTISSYFTSNSAPLTILRASVWYPLVRKRRAFSTRSGVRRSPSRRGSSPSRTSTSANNGASPSSPPVLAGITFTTALFDLMGRYLKDVARSFGDAHFVQLRPGPGKRFRPVFPQPAEDLHAQVFRSRHQGEEALYFRVEVAVLERIEYVEPHQAVQPVR